MSRLDVAFRVATKADLSTLVAMLADDELGAMRENATSPLPASYHRAFDAIESDPNNQILIAEAEGRIAGFLQLTFIPYLTYQGRWRALIEGVRVRSDLRGAGVGAALIEHAVDRARDHPCHLVQLTTDKRRPAALRFYERLGFRSTHEGMKLHFS